MDARSSSQASSRYSGHSVTSTTASDSMNNSLADAQASMPLSGFSRPALTIGIDADHDPVRIEGVMQRRSLAQELRIGRDRKAAVGLLFVRRYERVRHQCFDPVPAPFGHGGLVDHHGELGAEMPPHVLGGSTQVGEVRAAAVPAGRAHGDEDHIGRTDRRA